MMIRPIEKIKERFTKKKEAEVRLPIDRTGVSADTGLNAAQIEERKVKGYVNDVHIGTSKSYLEILRTNIFTFFNILSLAVFIWMMTASRDFNDVKNGTFFVIIVVNTLIGIVQEIRAKITMDKMSLLSSPDVTVLREGGEVSVKLNEILIDDVMKLSPGKQVCSDCKLVLGEVEVNESLLTGEALPIKKKEGDILFTGSFIVSGRGTASVTGVGRENYIQRLAEEAKKFKSVRSELMRSLDFIMKIIAIVIVPLALLAFFTNMNANLTGGNSDWWLGEMGHLNKYSGAELDAAYQDAVFPTTANLIGMIPAGLFLLASVALFTGILRLKKKNALVQELYSIETLARVDMLCLDKTGTITDGTMSVKEVIPLGRKYKEDGIKEIISSMQYALEEDNSTAVALQNYFGKERFMTADFTVPFSSERKTSAIKCGENLFIIGAPEFVTTELSDKQRETLGEYAQSGHRCLLLAYAPAKAENSDKLPKNGTPIALIIIEDNIKVDAKETIAYFAAGGVEVKVISGDNPVAVAAIAGKAGVPNADNYVSLMDVPDEEVIKLAFTHTVFGRVSPSQKKLLIKTFKEAGKTVAMTGDGINDILAMKEADCSIAMANGSEATRNVANLVLLDSNFGSMPAVVAEGRRVINNIERSGVLFLTKTVLFIILSFLLIAVGRAMPLDPVQITFINLFVIGIPSFVLALEPNNQKISGKFLTNVLKRIIPGAAALAAAVMLIVIFDEYRLLSLSRAELSTAVMLTIFGIYMIILLKICKPFNRVRKILLAAVSVVSAVFIIFSPMMPDQKLNYFNISSIWNLQLITLIISMIAVSYLLMSGGKFLLTFPRKKAKKLPVKGDDGKNE